MGAERLADPAAAWMATVGTFAGQSLEVGGGGAQRQTLLTAALCGWCAREKSALGLDRQAVADRKAYPMKFRSTLLSRTPLSDKARRVFDWQTCAHLQAYYCVIF
jgi:hypothetical protein